MRPFWSLVQLVSSLVQLENPLIQLKSSLIQLESSQTLQMHMVLSNSIEELAYSI